ncbi:MAG: sigma-70 family RNA polymerase sigma factor [Bacteroidetes bacterium]|nr:sigma-70 family RNA polymerase sigma factor [Bacteroidota bacterium]
MTREEFINEVLRYSGRLYSVAFRILRSNEDAEDAVQETLLRLWNKRNDISHYESIEALCVTVIRNLALDRLRQRKREGGSMNHELNETGQIPSPHEVLQAHETIARISEAINRLPDAMSEAIRKRDVEGESYEEIAVATGQNINSVRVAVSRARKILQEQFRYERPGLQKAGSAVAKVL